jgi:stearoyl-CoA desaturase (delta-9 desaturase)
MALATLRKWLDTQVVTECPDLEQVTRIDWLRAIPFVFLHLACLAVFAVGVSPVALEVATGLYAIRMFSLTGFYHRYFSHRTFRTSRVMQFVFALLGASCVQRGPLWWAAHHRTHHRYADTALDPHSPTLAGFAWSHVGWFMTARAFQTDWARIPDLRKYPELRWLDRFDIAVPVTLAVFLFGLGMALHHLAPGLGTNGWQMLIWGFCVSTVVLFHATVTINSLAHRFGGRRFDTLDDSRNNLWLALITFGEGWHNNHHFYPGSARQGFRWWEIDLTWYGLRVLAGLGLVWDLRPVPDWVAGRARP